MPPGHPPLGFHAPAKLLDPQRVDQDLDARLVLVVPASLQVVDAHDRLDVGEEVTVGKERAQHLADDRRASEPAADQDLEAAPPVGVRDEPQADVVRLGDGAVAQRSGHRDLELARQVGELRVQGRPLAQQLAVRAGIGDLVGRDAGQVVAGDVAYAVAAGLNGVHVHRGEIGEDVRHPFQGGPVELDVLARGEVAVAAVVARGDRGEHPQLRRRQDAVGDRHPEHRSEPLDVEPVHQPQGLELAPRRALPRDSVRSARESRPPVPGRAAGRRCRTGTWSCLPDMERRKPPSGVPDGGFLVSGDGWIRRASAHGPPKQKAPSGTPAYRCNNT